ncbi:MULTISPECIES: hypothetical protein [Pseudomonas]|uniref:Uncharacterized protein n=3 Tax=Gammaproteobacteria TaxID=1236 RepID=A0A653AZG5_ECTOL|nr:MULTISPECIES: hypothetical protein [Pseudomonas]QTS85178.1 hypothetical protein JLK41_17880 [Pseudomonas khazarica]WFC63720.1 hypothetical protein EWH21_19015 [Pseudomonas sp. REST10]CAE6944098.1 conserved protein of unknown function [Pseudomonas oleovorans]
MDINRFERTRMSYENVPVYRKRWFVFLSLLFFIPATLLIALTGDLYAQKDGVVYKFKNNAVHQLIVTAVVFMMVGLFLAAGR